MREVKYLSPTSIMTWRQNKEEFYLRYLAEDRPPRFPQTKPMSVGSAFDAYIKSHLQQALFGKSDFKALFEAQVEPQNREWAIEAGEYCFHCYKTSGAIADLMLQLINSPTDPRFEFTTRGIVNTGLDPNGIIGNVGDVVLLGKPDAAFVTKDGAHVILDWKVNGFCSKYNISPMPGYVMIRDGWTSERAQRSKGSNTHHKTCWPTVERGIRMNVTTPLNKVAEDWAIQLSIYSWLSGEEVGSKFICAIDQLCCKPDRMDEPLIRVAQHRNYIDTDFQLRLYDEISQIWEIVHSDHIFRDVSLDASQERCGILDEQAASLRDIDPVFSKLTRGI